IHRLAAAGSPGGTQVDASLVGHWADGLGRNPGLHWNAGSGVVSSAHRVPDFAGGITAGVGREVIGTGADLSSLAADVHDSDRNSGQCRPRDGHWNSE